MTREESLRKHLFVAGLEDRHIARLATLATEVHFAESEVVMFDGQRSRYFYLVLEGSVSIELHTQAFTVSVVPLGPDKVFGWSALLDQQDTLFQVRARENTRALCISGADLVALCRSDPELGVEILVRTLRVIAGRIKATEAKFAEMCGVRVGAEALM